MSHLQSEGSSHVLCMPTHEQKRVSEDGNQFPSSTGVLPRHVFELGQTVVRS
jgi:hypothetical protein